MKKILILLFSILVSVNSYSDHVKKSDYENKTYIYSLKGIEYVDRTTKYYTIHHQYLKNGTLKAFNFVSDGSVGKTKESTWWVENNFLYVIESPGDTPIKFRLNSDTNLQSWEGGSEMTIRTIDGVNVSDDDWIDYTDTGLIETYINYLMLKNLYNDGDSYYVSGSEMDKAKELASAIQDFYFDFVTSTDEVWDKALIEYEKDYSLMIRRYINSYDENAKPYVVDFALGELRSLAYELDILNTNTVKDF